MVTDENNKPVENDPGISVNGVQWGNIEGGKTEQTAIDMLLSAPNGVEVFFKDGKIEIWWVVTDKDGNTQWLTADFSSTLDEN